MPRATSQKFSSAAHQPAAGSSKTAAAKTGGGGGEGGTNNPLFNTDKFGQHILKVRPSSSLRGCSGCLTKREAAMLTSTSAAPVVGCLLRRTRPWLRGMFTLPVLAGYGARS